MRGDDLFLWEKRPLPVIYMTPPGSPALEGSAYRWEAGSSHYQRPACHPFPAICLPGCPRQTHLPEEGNCDRLDDVSISLSLSLLSGMPPPDLLSLIGAIPTTTMGVHATYQKPGGEEISLMATRRRGYFPTLFCAVMEMPSLFKYLVSIIVTCRQPTTTHDDD